MDGDAVDVSVAWLTEVFQNIEDSSDLTVFKVSALGAQSCGKSTLLNTTFGLNFPVSSGRCTRGAYMQLVKVDETLKKKLKCDYLAVIDSEGLMSRTRMGIRDLNIKTLVAAKDTDHSDRYTKFTDVLQYDATKDNTYVPGLWDGSLPMAKTNAIYSKTMQQLKLSVVTSIEDMQEKRQKSFYTFEDFTHRLQDIWRGIKFENFVFTFRNVLAVEAHRRLTSVFNGEQWSLKREIRKKTVDEEDSIMPHHGSLDLEQLVENSKLKLQECLGEIIEEMRTTIEHYFKCPGCSGCDFTVKNRHLLANNEKEFEDDVNWLHKTLIKELELSMEELKVRMEIEIFLREMEVEINDKLRKKVREIFSMQKPEDITKEVVEKEFRNFWEELTRDAMASSTKMLERDENIKAVV